MARAERWPPYEVTSLRQNLDALSRVVRDDEKALEPETRGWLARLLVVRSAGYIEQAVSECCRTHVRAKAGGWIQSFAHSWLERSKNPTPVNLAQLVGRFDQSASDEFDLFLKADDEVVLRDLSSLVDKRNRIAHGLNEGVNPDRALVLAETAERVVDWFILKFNPFR